MCILLFCAGGLLAGISLPICSAPDTSSWESPLDRFDFPETPLIQFDLAQVLQTSDWTDHLRDLETVINDAALLREPDLEAVHSALPKVRYAGAEQSGVKHEVLILAISVHSDVATLPRRTSPAIRKMTNYSDIDWSDCHGSVAKRP